MNIINKNGAFISGSFIIQCVLDEYWESDIDIFCPHRDNEIVKSYTDDYNFNDLENYLYNNNYGWYTQTYQYMRKYNGNYDPDIIHVRDYDKENKKDIQIIALNIDKNIKSYQKFIENRFDFNICKNMYVGGQLYIYNLDDILNKVTNFECTTLLNKTVYRYHKYKKHGFIFKNDLDLTYKNLKHADEYKTVIYAIDINNVPSSIKKFTHVRPYNNEIVPPINECNVNECIVCFRDPTCKHAHYSKIRRKNRILLL